MIKLINDDCLVALKDLEPNTIDALVTDPPAGISFMGKAWDDDKGGRKQWCAWMTEVMQECLRVMKPGAHGLIWAIPRTSHWTGSALEDAGFEVRDVISHLFGSGFPKSMDISKAINKAAGKEGPIIGKNPAYRERQLEHNAKWETAMRPEYKTGPATEEAKQWQGYGTALKPACEMWFLVRKKPAIDSSWLKIVQCAKNNSKPSHAELNVVKEKLAHINAQLQSVLQYIESIVADGRVEAGSDMTDTFVSALEEASTDLSIVWLWNNTLAVNLNVAKMCITLMELKQTIELKISNYCLSQNTLSDINSVTNTESIFLIRKPISEKTVAANVLKWGVGGLNIDGCRIDLKNGETTSGSGASQSKANTTGYADMGMSRVGVPHIQSTQGRFPANLVLSHNPDCEDDQCSLGCAVAMLDEQSGFSSTKPRTAESMKSGNSGIYAGGFGVSGGHKLNDSGGASRFFFTVKNDKKLNECDSGHTFAGAMEKRDDNKNSIAGYGNKITGQFLPDTISIIKTATTSIINFPILCALAQTNIGNYTLETEKNIEQFEALNIESVSVAENGECLISFIYDQREPIPAIVRNACWDISQIGERNIGNTGTHIIGIDAKSPATNITKNILIKTEQRSTQEDANDIAKKLEPVRFLYCAKTSTSERNAGLQGLNKKVSGSFDGNIDLINARKIGANPERPNKAGENNHPTVKAQKLMRYLCRLITPPNGIVLDPFMGSGSTGLAAVSEGFKFVGIEKDSEYFEICKRRINKS